MERDTRHEDPPGSDGGGQHNEERPPQKRQRRWPAVIANVVLGILFLGAIWPPPTEVSGPEETGRQIGRAFGLLLLSLPVSYGIWRLVAHSRQSNRKWSPWVLLIAAFLATFLKVRLAA